MLNHPLHDCLSLPSGRVMKKDTLVPQGNNYCGPQVTSGFSNSHLRILQLILIRPTLIILPFSLLPTLSSLPEPTAQSSLGSWAEI